MLYIYVQQKSLMPILDYTITILKFLAAHPIQKVIVYSVKITNPRNRFG